MFSTQEVMQEFDEEVQFTSRNVAVIGEDESLDNVDTEEDE